MTFILRRKSPLVLAAYLAVAPFALGVDSEPVMKTKLCNPAETFCTDVTSGLRATVDSAVTSSVLPSGAATSVNQNTANSSLSSIDAGIPAALGQTTMANSMPVVLPSNQSAIPVTQSGTWTTGRTWTLLNTTDSVNAVQSGTWTTARSWTLSSGTDSIAAVQSGTWNINNISGTISLPTGASTSALQTTGNTSLSSIDTKTPALGQTTMAGSVPVAIASNQSAIPVSQSGTWTTARSWTLSSGTDSIAAIQSGTWNINNISGTISLPTGAATSANQTIANSSLSSIDTKTPALGQAAMAASVPVTIASNQSSFPIVFTDFTPANQTITALDSGTSNLTGANGQVFYFGTPTTNSAATYALSSVDHINVQANLLGGGGTLVAEVSMDGGSFWFRPNVFQVSTQSYANGFTAPFMATINVAGMSHFRVRAITSWSGTGTIIVRATQNPRDLTIGDALPSGANTIGAVSQNGTWNINNVTGTVSLPTGAATSANQTIEVTSLQVLDDVPTAANGAFVKGEPMMGQLDDASTVVATEDNLMPARITAQRAIHTNLRSTSGVELGTSTNPVFVNTASNTLGEIDFGDITTAATTQVAVNRTAYTEQTTNGQRSIKSASVNDASAGTGARTVNIIYYDQTGAGPTTETITMNGTTCVATVSSTIAFIEEIQVATVGSTGSNAGILTLSATNACGGTTIGTVGATDNQALWTHHYVAAGKTASITGITVSNNGTTTGAGGVFVIKAIPLNVANQVEIQISDFIRLYGQANSFSRTYTAPIKIVGPARLVVYVTPETASSTVYRASIDFYEQ